MTNDVLRRRYMTAEQWAAHLACLAEVDAGLRWSREKLGLAPVEMEAVPSLFDMTVTDERGENE